MVIDFHTHNFPDALAPKAIRTMCDLLQGRFQPVADGTVASQLRDMAAAGIDRSVVCPIATKPAQFDVIFRRSCAVRDGAEGEEAARRLLFLVSVHPFDPDFRSRVRALARAGFPGVVFHPYYQGFRLDDPAVVPVFKAVRDEGLFAVSHCGRDCGFADAPMTCGPMQIEALLKAVPGLTFVACHLGGFDGSPARAVDRLLPFERCYIDTARVANQDGDPEAERILREFPVDRILFGTDYFWREEALLKAWVADVHPDARAREKIFHLNAERLLGPGARRI
ncbi:MAG: amidohydrolase family protein [Kiritimatiellia bacterium]